MEPTLDIGQRVLVDRVSYHFGDPEIGDIVVFHPPEGAINGNPQCGAQTSGDEACPQPVDQESDTNFIKRIVAGPGDTSRSGTATRSSTGWRRRRTSSGRVGGGTSCTMPETITIPPDHYFMMGDNRGASDDSRFWGPVPRSWIIGEAFFTYWPPDRIGLL